MSLDKGNETEEELRAEIALLRTQLAEVDSPLGRNESKRFKMLECLYQLSSVIDENDRQQGDFLKKVPDLLPPSWQYPQETCARVVYQSDEYHTRNYVASKWIQQAPIMVDGIEGGFVEVRYLKKMPKAFDGPFLKEEVHLITEIAGKISRELERRRARVLVEVAEQKFKQFVNKTDCLVTRVDMDGNLLYVNNASTQFWGIGPDACLGKSAFDFVHPDDRERTETAFANWITTEIGNQAFENRQMHVDGSYRWCLWTITAEKDTDGNTTGFNGFAVDLSVQKAIELALIKNEAVLSSIFEQAAVGVALVNTQTSGFLMINKKFCEIIGYSREEVLAGININELTHPDDLAKYLQNIKRLVGSHCKEFSMDKRYIKKDGAPVYVRLTVSPTWQADETPDQYIAIVEDITEHKLMQIALAEQETLHLAFMEHLNVGIVAHSPDTSILYANTKASELLGLDLEQMMGRVAKDQAWNFVRSDQTELPLAENPVTLTLTKNSGLSDYMLGIVRTDRDYATWVLCNSHIARNQKNHIDHVVISFYEITDLVETRNALASAVADLNQFAYATAHDLKSPLRAIEHLANWAAEDLGSVPKAETSELLAKIQARTHRMRTLINGILQYSQFTMEKSKYQDVDSYALVQSIVNEQFEGVPQSIKVSKSLPTIQADPIKLRQVFSNLIGNAIKYHDKDEDGTVKVSCKTLAEFWKFSVSDNGPGIDAQYQEKIFVFLQTLQPQDTVESTGIGLALVKRIVQIEGGSISVESELGKGATFTFKWPKRISKTGSKL